MSDSSQNLHPLAAALLDSAGAPSSSCDFKDIGVQETPVRGRGRPAGTTYSDPAHAARRAEQRELSTPPGYEDEMLDGGQSIPQVDMVETPTHRLIIYYRAAGMNQTKIAEQLGLSKVTVGNVLKQPWAKQRLVKELVDAGKDVLSELIRGEAVDCIHTLVEIRDNANSPASARLGAANQLLDRFLGKPVVKTENTNKNLSGSLNDVDAIDRDLARLRGEQELLTGKHIVRPCAGGESQPASV